MGTWINFNFYINLTSHAPTGHEIGETILEQVKDWAQEVGYLEGHTFEANHLNCYYSGEANWGSRDELIDFLEDLARDHQVTITLNYRHDGEDAETLHFGPEAGEMTLEEVITFDLEYRVLDTINRHQAALTPELIRALTGKCQALLELAGVVVNSRRLKNIRLLLSRDREAAMHALDDLIAELEQAEDPPVGTN